MTDNIAALFDAETPAARAGAAAIAQALIIYHAQNTKH